MKHRKTEFTYFTIPDWKKEQDYCGYSYFRKPASKMSGEEAIFCDDASRLDMICEYPRLCRGN